MALLMPRKVKFRKQHRGRRKGVSGRGNLLAFGSFGLKSLENGWLTGRQIEAARRSITRACQRGGQVYIRVFPDHAVSSTPIESGMGGGKGAVSHYVAVVRRGRILFELGGVNPELAREALRLAAHKLPFKTSTIERRHHG